jgi:putative membrane protein
MRTSGWIEEVEQRDLLKGIIAGMLGGLAGAWVMNQYHTLASRLQQNQQEENQGGRESGQEVGGRMQQSQQHEWQHDQGDEESEEPATEKAATAVVTGLLGREMTEQQKHIAGSATHYAFGASVGGVYGALAEVSPVVRAGMGTAYGAGVWLAADEVAVPVLRLAKPPQQHPASTHLNALVAHLVYGLSLEIVRRLVRAIM